MKHLAAYLLLGLGGNTSPSADDVKGVLSSVGIDADEERLDKLIDELKGKDLQEVIFIRLRPYKILLSNIYITADSRRFYQARIRALWWRRRRRSCGGYWSRWRRCCAS